MKIGYGILTTIIIVLISSQVAMACWGHMTIEELIEISDVVIIGEVVDKSSFPIIGEKLGKFRWRTYNKWEIRVNYILHGKPTNHIINVGTPDEYTSAYYNLPPLGSNVILFLRKEGRHYYLHSPQAVVEVT